MGHGINFCKGCLFDGCSTALTMLISLLGTVYCFHTRMRFGKQFCNSVCTEVVRRHWCFQSYLRGGWVSMRAHKRGWNALTDPLVSIYADVYPDPVTRGRALTIFMTVSNPFCILLHKIEEDAGEPNPQYLRAYQTAVSWRASQRARKAIEERRCCH